MAVSPEFAASLAEEVGRIYEAAELRILERLLAILTQGLDGENWEREALGRIQALRRDVIAVLQSVAPEAAEAIMQSLDEAYSVGALAAYREVAAEGTPAAHAAAVRALAAAALVRNAEAAPFILRATEDAARRVIREVVAGTVTGTTLRREALQRALNGLVREGFATVPVGRGTMNAADYARMAVRTATAQAMIEGHQQALTDLGLHLVTVTPGPRACRICDDWAGKVLSTDGTPAGRYLLPGRGAQAEVWVTVDGTLAQARAAGVYHPNCRCAMRAFVVGITKRREVTDRPAWDEKGYRAQQKQRGLERGIRRAKERQALATTPKAAAAAARDVRAAQAHMREHLKANPALKRQSAREQVLRPEAA